MNLSDREDPNDFVSPNGDAFIANSPKKKYPPFSLSLLCLLITFYCIFLLFYAKFTRYFQ